jgi:gliding motility-associated-like protein
MKTKRFILIIIALCYYSIVHGQLYINELQASNSKTFKDEKGNYSDWVELYNAGNQTVDITGYYVSDDPENLNKFQLKAGAQSLKIAPKGFLVLWCSNAPTVNNTHLPFALSAIKESFLLVSPDGKTIVNKIDFENQRQDVAYGRQPDGSQNLKYFTKATPKTTNNASEAYLGFTPAPIFSQKGGFYTTAFDLKISAETTDIKVFVSTDGSEPSLANLTTQTYSHKNKYIQNPGDSEGPLLTRIYKSLTNAEPIKVLDKTNTANSLSLISSTWDNAPNYFPKVNIAKATVVRAVAIKPGYLPSDIVTQSYFINHNGASSTDFPVISVTIPEKNLFDYNSGFYTAGKSFDDFRKVNPNLKSDFCTPGNFSNEGDEWEMPGNFELFDQKKQVLNQSLSFKIHGACSRSLPYKSLRVYGNNYFDNYAFFNDSPDLVSRNIILRNSGNDYNGTLFRDSFIHTLVQNFQFGIQRSKASVVYLNGEYWGIHNIRERLDKYYLNTHYGVKTDQIDLRKIVWTGPDEIEYGDGVHYDEMMSFLKANNLTTTPNYEKAKTYFDIDNLIDYQIAEIFVGNIDWPQNNVRLWRNRTETYSPFAAYGQDGRWRYLFYDAEKSLGMVVDANFTNLQQALTKEENFIFRKFLENESFKNLFIARFSDKLNTTFKTENSLKLLQTFRNLYDSEITKHNERWNTLGSKTNWISQCNIVQKYLSERPETMRQQLQQTFGLETTFTLKIATNDLKMGVASVNQMLISPETDGVVLNANLEWEGKYYKNKPITITAEEKPGFRFLRWEHDGAISTEKTIVVISNKNTSYKAFFEQTNLPDISNIPPASLADCGYFFEEWAAINSKGSNPPNSKFVFLDKRDPDKSAGIAGFTDGLFDYDTRSRIMGEGQNGVTFINTSGPNEHPGYPYGQLGGFVMAANTEGLDSLNVSWTCKTSIVGTRKYAISLFYRVGENGSFKEIENSTYNGFNTENDSKTFTAIRVPDDALKKPYVQFFWKYYYTGSGKSGARDALTLDDINFKTKVAPQVGLYGATQAEGFSSIDSYKKTTLTEGHTDHIKVQNITYSIADDYSKNRPKTPTLEAEKLIICGTEKIKINALGCINGTVFWSNGATGKTLQVAEGKYSAYCSSTCGVSDVSAEVEIKRSQRATPPFISSDKEIICLGETVSLSVSECAGKTIWSNGLEGALLLVKPSSNVSYTASCYANQCLSEVSNKIDLKLGLPHIPKIKTSSSTICLGQSAQLTAEGCTGLVEWSNGFKGEVLKVTPTAKSVTKYKAKCKSKDGDCVSNWSAETSIETFENPSSPDNLVEIANVCGYSTVNLTDALLNTKETELYTFHELNDPNSPIYPNSKLAKAGTYYIFNRNNSGCISNSSKLKAISNPCTDEIKLPANSDYTDIKISISSDKNIAQKNEPIQLKISVENIGKNSAKNIIVGVPILANYEIHTTGSEGKYENGYWVFKIEELKTSSSIEKTINLILNAKAETKISANLISLDQIDENKENNSAFWVLNSKTEVQAVGLNMTAEETQKISNGIYAAALKIDINNITENSINPIDIKLDLAKTFGNGASLVENSLTVTADKSLYVNPTYEGKTKRISLLIDSLSTISARSKNSISLSFKVNLSKATTPNFYANAWAEQANSILDISTDGNNHDPDQDGDPTNNQAPTLIKFDLGPAYSAIACSQLIVDSVKITNDQSEYTLLVLIKNLGNTVLNNIHISQNLRSTFGPNSNFKILGTPSISTIGNLKASTDFDGYLHTNLLDSTYTNTLEVGQLDSVFFSFRIASDKNSGPFFNNSIIKAQTPTSAWVSDTSNSGKFIIPLLSDPTVFMFSIEPYNQIQIRDGFSPNADGKNDNFEIFIPKGLVLEYLEIFDRFGQKIKGFSEADILDNKILWDGSSQNLTGTEILNSGTYFYSYKTKTDPNNYVGFFTVLK